MNEEEYETQISAEYIYMLDKQQEKIEQLQNNWNELKKWLEDKDNNGYEKFYVEDMLILMQELEGNNE